MEKSERDRRHRVCRESRQGSKFFPLPLFMQIVGILHFSALLCARAVAVTGAVGYAAAVAPTHPPTTVVSTRGGEMVASIATDSSGPEHDEPVLKSSHNERTIAKRRCVTASAGRVGSAYHAQGRAAYSPAVALWDRRRTAPTRAGNKRSSTRAILSAFLPPPSARCVCVPGHRTRARSRGLSSPVVHLPSRPRVLVSGRRCPLSMTSATDIAEAAVAFLGAFTAIRFALPEVDHGYVGLRFPSAVVQGSVSGMESAGSDDRWIGRASAEVSTSSNSGNGGSRSRSSTSRVQQALVSLVRWVLSGGRVGVRGRRRPRVMPRVPEEERDEKSKSGGLLALLSWIWRFVEGENSIARADNKKDIAEVVGEKSGSGVVGSGSGRDLAVMSSASTAATAEGLTLQQIYEQYPRPQSTAYPRPLTVYPRPLTAYPRPRVSVPTLLDLDQEEPVKVLPTEKGVKGKGNGSPILSDFLCWFFARMITKRSKLVEGLEVNVDARSNREAMSGLLQEVGITFNHLELENLRISGGAVMAIRGLDLKVLTLLWRRFKSFKKPFEVSGSYVFTSEDLACSPMVRRLVDRMMNATLRMLETYATDPLSLSKSVINISQVTAKRSRLVIDGEMVYENARVPFNYRTSIGVRGKGHVVYLKDSEVFWENVGGSLSLPLVPLQTFDVDIGDGARIESIRIVNGKLAVRARFVLSPFPPLVVASMLKRAALRYDVGEKLSVIFGNLIQKMKF